MSTEQTDSGPHHRTVSTGETAGGNQIDRDTVSFILYLFAVGFLCSLGLLLVACGRSDAPDQQDASAPAENLNKQAKQQEKQEPDGAKGATGAESTTGASLYNRYCAACHGEDGTGNGPAAEYLYPHPRDLTGGTFKFTSTATGKLPTDEDLHETIARGLRGTGMPGFRSVLSPGEIDRLVKYVKTFSPRFDQPTSAEPITVPEPPEQTEELVQRGKKLYTRNACWTCHGRDGEGDGPSAASLRGPEGNLIQPRNLTTGVYKSGGSPEELYKVIMTGITGTGMPGYASGLSDESDRWALVYYVRSLSDAKKKTTPPRPSRVDGQIAVERRSDLPSGPTDDTWDEVSPTRMPLFPLWSRPSPPPVLSVHAAHDGSEIAVRLTWTDPTRNISDISHRSYPDAVAIQYPVDDGPPPFIGMGSAKKNGLVRIWHWKSVRQAGKERGRPFDLEDVYPRTVVDRYYGQENRAVGEMPDFVKGKDNIKNQKNSFQSAVDAGNPLAKPSMANRSVLEYLVRGFGTLTALPEKRMSVRADGVWKQGKWRVQFRRSLTAPDSKNRDLTSGETIWVGFAAFDGTYQERNGKKSISNWIQLKLQEK